MPTSVRASLWGVSNVAESIPEVILELLAKTPTVKKLCADSGYAGPKLAERLREQGLSGLLEIVPNPRENRASSFNLVGGQSDLCLAGALSIRAEARTRLSIGQGLRVDCSEFASVGETGCMLVSKEAGYPKLVQREVPGNPLGNDLWNRL